MGVPACPVKVSACCQSVAVPDRPWPRDYTGQLVQFHIPAGKSGGARSIAVTTEWHPSSSSTDCNSQCSLEKVHLRCHFVSPSFAELRVYAFAAFAHFILHVLSSRLGIYLLGTDSHGSGDGIS
ncbi:hypothetical protein RvY_12684 [Ramazzottius varieornatus]|uniref:Uncharacterized protein n=1 Tax=Ramazzottius varieornatus TaxID=947166 RepID=A0A1D1VPI2_RAMVA|nr:hypothetical protein RvY_12684 [Ramazzottius varieornatus]